MVVPVENIGNAVWRPVQILWYFLRLLNNATKKKTLNGRLNLNVYYIKNCLESFAGFQATIQNDFKSQIL